MYVESGIFLACVGLSQHTIQCQLAMYWLKTVYKQRLAFVDGYLVLIPMPKIYTIPIK
jgi:hypothetical protein